MNKDHEILAKMTGFDVQSIERRISRNARNLPETLFELLAKAKNPSLLPTSHNNSVTLNFQQQEKPADVDSPNTNAQDTVIRGIPSILSVDDTDDTEAVSRMNSPRYSMYTALGWNPEMITEYLADPQNPKWNNYTTSKPPEADSAKGGPDPNVAAANARAAEYLQDNFGPKRYNPATGQWEPVKKSVFPSTFKKSFFFLNALEK
ncbi:MAG: hypothetical protein EBR94_08750 [Bacteroidetes bacterium]|nr:hypothetical protein [Bacteroidota bacterium]